MGILRIILRNIQNMRKASKIRKMDKAQLLAMEDEDFYDAIHCVCADAVLEITDPELTEAQRFAFSLTQLEAEVNNGGLCQFFVNSSGQCAPYVSDALAAIGADSIKELYDSFLAENNINVNDLSSFKITDIGEYEEQTQRYDFDSFDDRFYADVNLHKQIIAYARENVEQIVK